MISPFQTGAASARLNSVESNLQNAEKQYKTLEQNFDEKGMSENLNSQVLKRRELEAKLNEIDREISSLHKQSSQQAELEIHQNGLRDKEKHILALKSKHEKDLELLFDGQAVPEKNLKGELDRIQKSLVNYLDKTARIVFFSIVND